MSEPDPLPTPTRLEHGLHFEDFELGRCFYSEPRTIDQATIEGFAAVSGDDNPVHLDAAFARRTPLRGIVAHGALTQAVGTGLGWRTGIFRETLIAIAENNASYLAPVRPDDSIRLELEVAERELEPAPKRAHVRLTVRTLNQRGELVATGSWLCLVRRDPGLG